jgi:integrase
MYNPSRTTYRIAANCPGRFPTHVVKQDGTAHPELTLYANKASDSLSKRTVPIYLAEVLRVFTWVQQDTILQEDQQSLLGPIGQVRRILYEYLTADCKCVLRQRRDGKTTTIFVRTTNQTRVNVKLTLAVMKHFYATLIPARAYKHENPLVSAELVRELKHTKDRIQEAFVANQGRRSPHNSGGVDDNWQHQLRYSTNYFQLANGEWKPRIIADALLPARILHAGRKYGWGLRETTISRMLFESGGRIGDIMSCTLGDWLLYDCLNRIEATSKGSDGRRVKTLVFTTDTTNLLKRYWNTERAEVETGPFKKLADFTRASKNRKLDPHTVPLFLSNSGKPYAAATFRDYYWRPALAASGIKCQPHQARHWFVTTSLDEIDKTAKNPVERQRLREKLVQYMAWHSGEAMLDVYDQSGSRAAEHVPLVHGRLAAIEQQYKSRPLPSATAYSERQSKPTPTEVASDSDFEALLRMGKKSGQSNAS